MSLHPRKRLSTSSLESIAVDFPPAKKQRTEVDHTIPFPTLPDDVQVEIPSSYPMEFNFGELAHEFVSAPVPGNEISSQTFDAFFNDPALNVTASNEASEVSSEEDKPSKSNSNNNSSSNNKNNNINNKSDQSLHTVASSLVSNATATNDLPDHTSSEAKTHPDPHQKRQADRAARNRESSRRAREKAKNRFRALENDNMALREMVRRFRMQNEHLLTQLDRANVMQQSCTMCRYNAAMAQQPNCQGPTPLLRQ